MVGVSTAQPFPAACFLEKEDQQSPQRNQGDGGFSWASNYSLSYSDQLQVSTGLNSPACSTGSAFLKVTNNLHVAKSKGQFSVFILINFSVNFDYLIATSP